MSVFEIQDWGEIEYRKAWAQQKELVEKRIRGEIKDQLIFCEHRPAVITLGRGSQREGAPSPLLIPTPGLDLVEIERGGLATWHGPGQLVVYPIFQLGRRQAPGARQGVLGLIRALENWVIDFCRGLGLEAQSVGGSTGVWIDGARKVASIGIAARHWVSYHGLSLNYSTGREPWQSLNPCGFSPEVMTDLEIESGKKFTRIELLRSLSETAPAFLG